MATKELAVGGLAGLPDGRGSCCGHTPDPCAQKFEATKMKGLGTVNRRLDACCDCQVQAVLSNGLAVGDVIELLQIPNDVNVLGYRIKVISPVAGLTLQFNTPQNALGAAVDMGVDGFTQSGAVFEYYHTAIAPVGTTPPPPIVDFVGDCNTVERCGKYLPNAFFLTATATAVPAGGAVCCGLTALGNPGPCLVFDVSLIVAEHGESVGL